MTKTNMTKIFTTKILKKFGWSSALLALALATAAVTAPAQDQYSQNQDQNQQDDPPSRVARLGYMEGSISFQPAGETDWVGAVPNRPITTGDQLWSDQNSRVELQLGSAVIRLNANTGFSFLNLDDQTVQIQLTSGSMNVRVRELDQNAVFEIDTPNLAFNIYQPGSYRVEASADGTYSVVAIREGQGEVTGDGQSYTLQAGTRSTFSGTDYLNAEVDQLGDPDQFDNWAYTRDRRWNDSRSAQYLSRDVVGYEDLDDNGDWRDDSNYGHVWFPNRVEAGWAPYRQGHWDWIPPWGYTWVDDNSWGYAPFHYGRWVTIGGRWGWVAGPVAVRPVYAPALVVFIGGGVGGAWGGNVGWFPLGPREVYVPSYQVSRAYVNRVNVSNTVVNTTVITNVYNTTIINKTTNVTNITYVNRGVQGAVTAVPQRAFAGAQPVARSVVAVNAQQIASASVSARVAVAPTRESVLGAKFATANRVTAPPAAVMNRQVVAKTPPPPPPVSFAKQQQAMAANPGVPLAKKDLRTLRPTPTQAQVAHPMVKVAPPAKPMPAPVARPLNQPGNNQPNGARPGQPALNQNNNQPGPRPGNQPGNQGNSMNQPAPNRPATNQPSNNQPPNTQPGNRPEMANPNPPNRPAGVQPNQTVPPQPANRPAPNPSPAVQNPSQPNYRPNQPSNPRDVQPEPSRPTKPAVREDLGPSQPPNNRPQPNQPNPQNPRPENARPQNERPENARPPAPQRNDGPPLGRPEPAPRPAPETRPEPTVHPQPQAPEAKPEPKKPEPKKPEPPKKEDERKKEKPPGS
ncbi:MAG TPA: DUF6600 domain-containing protein [Terriglobales bacterium]|nr:DUF6600 domain-containing protein [Terriglobales bacterium]